MGSEDDQSDSEPGNPRLRSQDKFQNGSIPYFQNIRQKQSENLSAGQQIEASVDIQKRKKSVQFLQERSSASLDGGIELVARKKTLEIQTDKSDHFRVRRSSAIDKEIEERLQTKKQVEHSAMLLKVIDPLWSQSMVQILNFREGNNNSAFAQMWSFLFFIIQTYNFFTAFFFVGIEGQPTGVWYLLEVICEILMIFDFVARWVIRLYFSQAWEQMYLLHDRGGVTRFHFYIRLIASVPYQIIISICVQDKPMIRDNIWIASLRLLKLLKFSQVIEYFNALEFQKRQQKNFSILQTMFVAYYLMCYIHVGNCLICLVGRIDPKPTRENNLGWLNGLLLTQFSHTIYDVYREAFANNLTTSLGLSFGQLIGTTELEWFGWTVWYLSGASIVVGYYSWMVAEWTLRNIKMYENSSRYEQAKQFCDVKNLPTDIRLRIRYYYQNMRINFEEYNEKTRILEQLPDKMKAQIAPVFNSQVLKNIKFLQMGKPEFVQKVACKIQPEVCLAGDLIVKYNEIADKMFFVQDGNLEVLSTDHFTTVAFLGTGTYFGEIGVLITGKRSLSIKALTNCLCYAIKSEHLLEILEEFPDQTQFLRAVGYQRLQTTHPDEIQTHRTTGKESALSNRQSETFNDDLSKYDKDISFLRLDSMPDSKRYQNDKIKTKIWLTKQYSDIDFFIMMPFSWLFYIWNTIMFLSFNYVFFLVPFGIGFKKDFGFDPALIVCQVVFALDIPLRMRTGITEPKHISTNLQQIFTYYINTWLFYDMLASIPIEYVLQIYYPEISRWVMLLKFFKVFRLYETVQIYLQNTNLGHFYCMFAVYCYIMYAFMHVGTCAFCYICEMYPKGSNRYDGRSLISFYNTLAFGDGDPMTWSNSKKYGFYWYVSSAIACNQGYGDTVPFQELEQYVSLFQAYFGRVIIAFACSDTANYLGEIYKSQQRKIMSTSYLNQWMKKIQLPRELIARVGVFNQMHFRFQHSIDEDQIMEGLPPTLIKSIKSYLFAPLIRTWEAISKENIGEVMSILEELELLNFPENEYIVKIGEVADEMYFIVEGLCQVLAADGNQITVLKQGQNFGEMALLDQSLPLRLASVKTLTTVKLAKLDRPNFNKIAELYPQFKENIAKMVQTRLKQLAHSKHTQQGNMREQIILKLQASESLSFQSSNLSESLTDSDFDEEVAKLGNTEDEDIYVNDENDDRLDQELKQKNESDNQSEVSPGNNKRRQWIQQAQLFEQKKNKKTDFDQPVETERKLITTKETVVPNQGRHLNFRKNSNKVANFDDKSSNNTRRQLSGQTSNTSQKNDRPDRISGSKKKGLVRSTTERLAANLADMNQQQKDNLYNKSIFSYLNWKTFYKFAIQLVVHYNLWFIPIHTAYKFPFEGVILAFEAVTLVVYGLELIYRILKYRHLNRILLMDESSLSIKDRKLKQDYDKLQNKIYIQKLEFVLTLIAIVPLNFIFQRRGWYAKNIYLDILVMTLRIVKYRQVQKIFEKLAPINFALIRVLETIYYNYIICSYASAILIDLCIWEPDARTTWLRRLPVIPSMVPGKVRMNPDYRADLSHWQIYLNAQYYIQGTLSHVAIGEITVTNEAEFYFNSVFMLASTFIYVYLFANIASVVSNLSSEIHLQFLKKKNSILQKLANKSIPRHLTDEINLYFDYQFFKYNGLTEKEMTEKLPNRIKLDIQLSQYQSVINSCILFRKPGGEFDLTLANSVLRTLKTEIFMSENFITKFGQTFADSFIVLEGTISVCGYNSDDMLGQLGPGDCFGTDLDIRTNSQLDKNYFQYTQGELNPKLKLSAKDNFENRSLLHLISKTFVVVGILTKSEKKVLYKAFPELKSIFRRCNRYFFDLGRKQIEKAIWSEEHVQPTREACLNRIKDHVSHVSFDYYHKILANQRIADFSNTKNLSYIVKNYYIIGLLPLHQKPLYKAIFGKEKQVYTFEAQKSGASWCCEDAYIEQHSNLKRAIRYIHFFNLVYTSFALPYYIGYNIRIRGVVLFVEILSSAISFMVFFLNFRTPYIENGQRSTEFIQIAKHYLKNGMIVDFFGMLPLNITLDFQIDLISKERMIYTCCLVGLARLTRMFSIMQIFNIFEIIKLEARKHRDTLQGIGNLMFCVLVGHWIVCLWTFLILVVEQHDKENWWYFQKMDQMPYWSNYIHNWYCVINITTGAGTGDIYAVTDIERAFFCFMMNCGDVIFALAFGLINQIALNTKLDDETGTFVSTMVRIERALAKFEISGTLKDQIEQFYTFKQKIEVSPSDLNMTDLEKLMPSSLVKKVLYYQFRDLVRPFCEEFQSENLVAEICYYLKSRICMPDDLVMQKGELGSHIYFFEEGEAYVIGPDGKKVVKVLQKGNFIGQVTTLIGARRQVSVRAKTFVLLKEISKEDLESILLTYPEIHERLKERALESYNQQEQEFKTYKTIMKELHSDVRRINHVSGSQSEESSVNSDLSDNNMINQQLEETKKEINVSFKTQDNMNYIQRDNIQLMSVEKKSLQGGLPRFNNELNKDRRMTVVDNTRLLLDQRISFQGNVPQQQTERFTNRQVPETLSQKDLEQSQNQQSVLLTQKSKVTVKRRLSGFSIEQILAKPDCTQDVNGTQPDQEQQ